ncbi:hypothetical protein [Paractinoplanes globisporus]|uniref:Uncharacterized protein n=1 Tax=Paractinoplanes globisporus TaxID=113565 RepID=A0ABW6WUI7_9ACTN|nr:hypothetical protein [Actinoplanes globisporus]
MNRWHAITEPQLSLPAVIVCAFGTKRRISDEQLSKPTYREAQPSA